MTGRHERRVIAESRYFSKETGREVSQGERIAAARARVAADKKRNVITEEWIVELAQTKLK